MKKIILILLLFPFFGNAQEHLDLLTIGYGQTFNNTFEGTSSSTSIKSFEADFTFPIVLSNKNVFITGASFSSNSLQLFPDAVHTSLYSTTLKVGLAITFNDFWSSTFVLLPKIASNYNDISSDDFYIGGFALLKFQKKKNLIYRFGVYGTTEAFGFFTTPILGWYYRSSNTRFEMDMSLPISGDINYRFGNITIGVHYFGIGRSFNIKKENAPKVYADLSSLEFASYLQFNTFKKSVLLRLKFGYSSNNYEVYAENEKIDLGLSAFSFGDDRTQLNPKINGSAFLKFEAIYRFHIKKKEVEKIID